MTKFVSRWPSSGAGGWIERAAFDAALSFGNDNCYAYSGNGTLNASDPSGVVNRFAAPLDAGSTVGVGLGIGQAATNVIRGTAIAGASAATGAATAVTAGLIYLAKVDDCGRGGQPSNVYVGQNRGGAASPGYDR